MLLRKRKMMQLEIEYLRRENGDLKAEVRELRMEVFKLNMALEFKRNGGNARAQKMLEEAEALR